MGRERAKTFPPFFFERAPPRSRNRLLSPSERCARGAGGRARRRDGRLSIGFSARGRADRSPIDSGSMYRLGRGAHELALETSSATHRITHGLAAATRRSAPVVYDGVAPTARSRRPRESVAPSEFANRSTRGGREDRALRRPAGGGRGDRR